LGFAPADWVLAFVTGLLLISVYAWRPGVQRGFEALAQRPWVCVGLLFVLPMAMRLLLLPHHPVPTPDVYDEFSHLLMADTLLHGRLANPPHPFHRFFETFFVLQEPTYSSIYPAGSGLVLAFGRLVSGSPWTGVLLSSGSLCAACYWMLRGWVAPGWALLGGILAVCEFGPLCLWTNSYWGGSFAATGGCLVFGALPRLGPRLRLRARQRDAVLLGLGFSIHMLSRQFETLLLFLAIILFLRFRPFRYWAFALIPVLPAVALILLQNRAVTHSWITLPEQLSQYQYGVPTSLTFEPSPTPHVPLTPQQELDYKAQAITHGAGDSISRFMLRLEYRVRYYRFFFLPPLYIALVAFLFTLREARMRFVAATLAIFALGTNLFPYLLSHYLAAVTCLFVLVSVVGMQQLSRIRIRGEAVGVEFARVLIVLCLGEFLSWYSLHLFESQDVYPILRYETWDSINHDNSRRRTEVYQQLAEMPGQLLVFVRYSAHHVYQNEWVWNAADIDGSRIVYARDLGAEEDENLIRYYPNRRVLLLEPDDSVPQISAYR
jgi:hypothetical protein